jgi:long-subunit fatty acid transport protein
MQGNPAGLAGGAGKTLDFGVVGLVDTGSFQNSANADAKIGGLAGALPYGAFAMRPGLSKWNFAAAVTPEILMRANWHYVDAPGTLGVTYGNQRQETQIIAVRGAVGAARQFGAKWAIGATVGVVYNRNDLHAPYIFQQQPQLAGLKVLLGLTTRGYGWNGGAGVQWVPNSRVRAGLAWKSGTTIRTEGDASGSASALFAKLGIASDSNFAYQAQVMNHLPQAFDAGVDWKWNRHLRLAFETDFTAWGQAFQQLPVALTNGTNATINSVVGGTSMNDAVPLHWNNQVALHGGFEAPVSESLTVRAGFTHANSPVPSSTLLPLTAAIMQNAIGTGVGFGKGRWHYDAAYQVQLPSTESVGQSAILAGEYNNSKVKVSTQSLTLNARFSF